MKILIESVRVSSKGKEILLKLKRRTGIEHWNEICRFAFFQSLADPKGVREFNAPSDTAIEMDWKTFAGDYGPEINVALLMKAHSEGVDMSSRELAGRYLRAHLEKGIIGLQNVKSLRELARLVVY